MKKRFIAGAVCPECQKMDKMAVYIRENGEEIAECVACGYQSLRPKEADVENAPKTDSMGVVKIIK